MTKTFNWGYKPAHEFAGSHVRDDKQAEFFKFFGLPDPLDRSLVRRGRIRATHNTGGQHAK